MTEQIEALPQVQSSSSTPAVGRPAKRTPGRGRGQPCNTDCKVTRKACSQHPREETKKKKGSRLYFIYSMSMCTHMSSGFWYNAISPL